jgi:hypothetical protein
MPNLPAGTTLRAADLNNRPIFDFASISGVSNIELDGVHLKLVADATTADHAPLLVCMDVNDVIIHNCLLEGGSNGNGSCVGRAIRLLGTNSNVRIENNEIHTVWKGMGLRGTNITARGNDIHTWRSDGINTGPCTDVLIEVNYIHDADAFTVSTDHRDSIQMMGAADGVILRNNFIDMGKGPYSQSIWSDSKNRMDNVVIDENVIINSHTNGIALHNIGKIDVTKNVMVWLPRTNAASIGIQTPKINVNATTPTVTGNTAPGIMSPSGVDALNTIQDGDPDATRAAARADARWAHFFGG